jgi:hypothetical protein
MNAFTLLPYALPFIALGTYIALRLARWLDEGREATALRRQAIVWHNAVVDYERSQGIYTYDGSITDITIREGYIT